MTADTALFDVLRHVTTDSLAGVLLVVFALFARGRLASGDRRA